MRTTILLGLTLLIVFCSCRSGSQEIVRTENVYCHPICGDDYIIGGPRAMALSDSILMVIDTKSDSMFLFFDIKAGKYLRKSGVRGRGPSEFTVISSLEPRSGSAFSFYDMNKRSYYKTNTISGQGDIQYSPIFHIDSIFPFDMRMLNNDRYVATGLFEDFSFSLLGDDGRVLGMFGEWPYRDEYEKKVSGVVRSQAYMYDIAVSPSKGRFVAHLLSADILLFYQVENDSVYLVKEVINTYPDYQYRNNPEHYSGASKDAPLNYLSVTSSEQYVYALYSGKTFREHALAAFGGNQIYVYTWDGEKVAVLKSDKTLKLICLSEDGKKMYAVACDPDPILVEFEVNMEE